MKQLIYNTKEYYDKTDEYYDLIAKKLLLEKQISRLGYQLNIPKEHTDKICNNCGYITNTQSDKREEYKDEPVVCYGYQYD